MSTSKQFPVEPETLPAPPPGRATRPLDPPRLSLARRGALPWHWLRSFLTRRLRLQRRGLQIHVLLEQAPAGDAVPATEPGRGSALRRDHEALHTLLDQRPELRLTMRPLAYIEQALALKGSRALKTLSPKLRLKVLDQLERLQRQEPELRFPELERRLRESATTLASDGNDDFAGSVHVSEASHSLFDEMERSWAGQIPPSLDAAVRASAGQSPASDPN
jgi:hypothetical protein